MDHKTYLVISFGNYSTKILIGSISSDDKDVKVIYYNEFITKELIINSKIIKFNELSELLEDELKKIIYEFGKLPENIIVNLPLRNIKIKKNYSPEYKIDDLFDINIWNKIFKNYEKQAKVEKNKFLITRKVYQWTLDKIDYKTIPIGISAKVLSFACEEYYIDKSIIDPYDIVLHNVNIKKYLIVTDEIIIPEAFEKNLRISKGIMNIGHEKTVFTFYQNNVLFDKAIHNFGLKDLTKILVDNFSIDEHEAIKILEKYDSYLTIHGKTKIPLIINFENNINNHKVFDLSFLNKITKNWLKQLIEYMNSFFEKLKTKDFNIEEFYFYSSSDIIKIWIEYLKAKSNLKIDMIVLQNNKYFLVENKFLSLIYSIIHEFNSRQL